MSLEDFDRLAWERIDGTISEENREILDSMMAADPEARHRFDGLCRLADELALVESAEPPPELRPGIDRALKAATPRWRRRAAVQGIPKRPLLYMAAGLLLGVAVGRLLIPASPVDRQHATGAMTPQLERPVGAIDLDLGEELGSVSLWGSGSAWTTEVTVAGNRMVELVFEAESASVDVRSMALLGSAKGEAVEEPGRLVLKTEGNGTNVTTFDVSGDARTLHLTILSDGLVLERRLVETGVPE